jgi:N-acetylglutamate synthase-like GNAT family acetyltransferase
VRPDYQHQGIATRLVGMVAQRSKEAGCEWLHVYFGPELAPFYFEACGFDHTEAGLLDLFALPTERAGG